MACIEHYCLQCGWAEFTNTGKRPLLCPQCGSEDVLRQFDEQGEHEDRDEYEEGEEEFDESLSDS